MKRKKKRTHDISAMGATRKGFQHKHCPTYKPPKADMSPAQFHHEQRAIKQRATAKHWLRLELYECPVCHHPKGKLGYCMKDQRWAVRKT